MLVSLPTSVWFGSWIFNWETWYTKSSARDIRKMYTHRTNHKSHAWILLWISLSLSLSLVSFARTGISVFANGFAFVYSLTKRAKCKWCGLWDLRWCLWITVSSYRIFVVWMKSKSVRRFFFCRSLVQKKIGVENSTFKVYCNQVESPLALYDSIYASFFSGSSIFSLWFFLNHPQRIAIELSASNEMSESLCIEIFEKTI